MDHFCPGCGTAQQHTPRYPWHFCNDCRNLAQDGAGLQLEFGNTHMSGGLYWAHVGSEDQTVCGAVRCLIHGRPVLVTEARFGGVVAQPIPDGPLHARSRLWDLTGAIPRPPEERKTPEPKPGRSDPF